VRRRGVDVGEREREVGRGRPRGGIERDRWERDGTCRREREER
jgi:hypothetical protein